jgi:RNA polymerase sigma-70 factor, ECF subfamily
MPEIFSAIPVVCLSSPRRKETLFSLHCGRLAVSACIPATGSLQLLNQISKIASEMEVFASIPQFIMKGITLSWSRSGKEPKDLLEMAVSDAQFVERLKRKDEHAFLRLYDLHHRTVYRFLMHMTGSITAAEELTQDVFVGILDAMCAGTIGQFDPQKGTWEGYLLGIARNLARAEQRRAHRVVSLDDIMETPEWNQLLLRLCESALQGDVVASLVTRSELKVLYRAILELPEYYREALVLCGLQEKSYRDAATILQCSEGTVASRMNRAKAILAVKLHKSAPNRSDELAISRGKEGTDVRTAIKSNGN